MTPDLVRSAVQKLENLNPDYEFVYEEALKIFLSLNLFPAIIDEIDAGTSLVRSRTHSSGEDFFYKISDIFIPPPEVVKSFARCNRPFQPKFYCSENRPTSYMELVEDWVQNIKPDDKLHVTISKWVTQKSFKVIIVTTPDKSLRLSPFDNYYGGGFDEAIESFDSETKEACILLYRYLFEKFRKHAKNDKKIYIITAAYCNLAFHVAKDKSDAIMYPSIPAIEKGMNFAFNKDISTQSFLKLESVSRNELTAKIGNKGVINFAESGILHAASFETSTNKIIW